MGRKMWTGSGVCRGYVHDDALSVRLHIRMVFWSTSFVR